MHRSNELFREILAPFEIIYRSYRESNYRLTMKSKELYCINKELEAFSYSVSHDLRAPLRSMIGFSTILLDEYKTGLVETAQDFLNRINLAGKKMEQLIDGLLTLSHLSRKEIQRSTVDLVVIAQTIIDELRQMDPERDIKFLTPEAIIVEGEPSLLHATLQNLLGNAWKFTQKQPLAEIELGTLMKNDKLTYFIRDNGVGFNMAYADKLFGIFQRLHGVQEFEGHGIGLATVQRIIQRHGGIIYAESEINKGATFYFTLDN